MATETKQQIISLRFTASDAQFAGHIVGGETLRVDDGWKFEATGGSVWIAGGRVPHGQRWEAPRAVCLLVWGEG